MAVLTEDGEHPRAEQVDATHEGADAVAVQDALDDAGVADARHLQGGAGEREHGRVEARDV